MKGLIFIVTLFTGTSSLASSHFDILRDTLSTCATLTQFKAQLETSFKDFRLSRKNERISRPIDFQFSQTVFEIEISSNNSYVKEFRVFLVSEKDDSLVLGTLQEIDYYDKVTKSENYIMIDHLINIYLNKHKEKYGLELSSKDFINQLTELKIYGFGCSEGGGYYPPEAKEMINLVNNLNYDKLAEWLRQISPELQAYAMDGMLQLEEKIIAIKEEDKELIQYLKERNSEIYHCSGCIYGITTTMEEIIKWKHK